MESSWLLPLTDFSLRRNVYTSVNFTGNNLKVGHKLLQCCYFCCYFSIFINLTLKFQCKRCQTICIPSRHVMPLKSKKTDWIKACKLDRLFTFQIKTYWWQTASLSAASLQKKQNESLNHSPPMWRQNEAGKENQSTWLKLYRENTVTTLLIIRWNKKFWNTINLGF